MKEVALLTLNIRRDRGDDGKNNWQYRKDLVARLLWKYKPDIAVFQEVLVHQLHDLISMLPGYRWTGVGRDDGAEAGEFSPIFYRGLEVGGEGTFWLSDTPDTPSCTWPGMTRICTWAEFDGTVPFSVFNTHLEYQYEETQLKSVDLITRRTSTYDPGSPVVLVGDFNFTPGSLPYKALSREFRDSHVSGGPDGSGAGIEEPATCHQFTGRSVADSAGAERIDYIWHRGPVQIADYRILTDGADNPAGVYLSDHWPVSCRIGLQ